MFIEKQLLMSVTMGLFLWLRFIDDIAMKWLQGRDNQDTFLQEANTRGYPEVRGQT